MRHKSDAFDRLKEYERAIANKFGVTIKVLRSDNGKEYCNQILQDYLKEKGIKFEPTAPYTPEQNGRAERSNRTINECARTMLLASGLPRALWAEAVNCAVYLLNRVSVTDMCGGKTAFELWTKKKPNLQHTRAFGTLAYIHIPKIFTTKFDARSKKTYLVGYEKDSCNYRVYEPSTRKVTVSRNVVFSDKVGITDNPNHVEEPPELFFKEHRTEERTEDPINEEAEQQQQVGERATQVPSGTPEQLQAPHQPANKTVSPPAPEQRISKLRDRSTIKPPKRYASYTAEIKVPTDFSEAVTGAQAAEWSKAISEELDAHRRNGTWTIIPRDPFKAAIRSKWVFKVSTIDGQPKFKARLCAKGFMQREGVDYTETFSPVVRYDSLRLLLAIAAQDDLEIATFDVRTAFLYGDLPEEIHMELPDGVKVSNMSTEESTSISGNEGEKSSMRMSVVCKLEKSLYGLKQAPRCWNKRFTRFLQKFKFIECSADSCVFYGKFESCAVYLGLFVDDGLLVSESDVCISHILTLLREEFEITVGDASKFVGMQIDRDRGQKTLLISQGEYTQNLLVKFGMSRAKPVAVPADPQTILHPVVCDEECVTNVPYREAVGSLMYLAVTTRPDISFAVNAVSKFLNKHNRVHWQAVKRIMSYLVGTANVGILYRMCERENHSLVGYSDADYANDTETRRSVTGYVFLMSGGAITWSSQRQKLVTLSTTEAEYVAAATAAREVVWLRRLLSDIKRRCVSPTVLYVDNQGAIKLSKNAEHHKRTKHIDVRYYFLREKQESGEISVEYVPTDLQKADGLTKALPRDKFNFMRCEIGLCEPEANY